MDGSILKKLSRKLTKVVKPSSKKSSTPVVKNTKYEYLGRSQEAEKLFIERQLSREIKKGW
jgi:hypothetical protein